MAKFNHPAVSPETPAEQAVHDASVIAWAATCGTGAWREATAQQWADYTLHLFRQRLAAEVAKLGLEMGERRHPSTN